jgi:hypothetical protein
MDRRGFLKLLLASAVAEAVDVEKLLWVPKPIITVPSNYESAIEGINRATFKFWRNQQVGGAVCEPLTLESFSRVVKSIQYEGERFEL